jgi:S1-C subfamily serine protease
MNLNLATKATVRIISHYATKDIFNPSKIDHQGKSVGTGFFINEHGYILTCFHVIADFVKLFINIPDNGKKSYVGRLISIYPEMDIAVIRIDGYKNHHYLKFGSSDDLKMGTDTIAIGYPLADETIKTTKGIISGMRDHLLQTDTPINEGNSGGPLLNNRFEVIGINSSKMAGTHIEGVGYSIPIDIFKTLQHKMTQESDHMIIIYQPNFYTLFQNLEQDTNRLFCHKYYKNNGLKPIEGYLITKMFKNSPLALAPDPLQIYDILMEFDNHQIDCYGDVIMEGSMSKINVTNFIKRYEVENDIPIKYFSSNRQQIISTTIRFENQYLYQIPEIFFPRPVNHIDVKGVVVCELTLNHISDIINERYQLSLYNLAHMYRYTLKENREEPRIFISRVLPESNMANNRNIEKSEGVVISHVNGIVCQTVDMFKKVCDETQIILDGKRYIHLVMLNHENITMCLD